MRLLLAGSQGRRRTDEEQPKGLSQTKTVPTDKFPWLLKFEAHRKQLLNYLRGSKIEVGSLYTYAQVQVWGTASQLLIGITFVFGRF